MSDPRAQAVIGDTHNTCGGSCAMSRNQHVHFPEGFGAFVDALATALADPVSQPEAVDPLDTLTERWQRAFAAVWGDLKATGEPGDEVLIKAAELALAMSR